MNKLKIPFFVLLSSVLFIFPLVFFAQTPPAMAGVQAEAENLLRNLFGNQLLSTKIAQTIFIILNLQKSINLHNHNSTIVFHMIFNLFVDCVFISISGFFPKKISIILQRFQSNTCFFQFLTFLHYNQLFFIIFFYTIYYFLIIILIIGL